MPELLALIADPVLALVSALCALLMIAAGVVTGLMAALNDREQQAEEE